MENIPDRRIAEMPGDASLPRKNGELVFDAPWEGRAFGMAVALNDRQCYDWNEFRNHLIAKIADSDHSEEPSEYYESWLASFEALVLEKGLVTPQELDARTHEFESGEREDVY
jgi:nitrile hydratase accessory protein